MNKNIISFEPNTTFLITGGAGFIGSNICETLLNMNYNVRCLDNFSTGKKENIAQFMENPRFTLINGDIRDLNTCIQACNKVSYVSHQAAWGSVPRSIELPLEYEEINIRGTLNMMEAARRCGVKRFVYASSSSVYGDHPILPKKEGQEGNLLSPYAFTKRADEEYGRLYTHLYGLETVGLRYFNVFGKRQDPDSYYAAVIPKFIKALIHDQTPVIYGDGRQSRDFTYIADVVQANLKSFIAPKDAVGQAYNIAFGGRVFLIDLYNKLCNLMNKDIKPLFEADRPGDIKHSNADISKAISLLGYQPEFDFNKGIEQAVEWYKENLSKR